MKKSRFVGRAPFVIVLAVFVQLTACSTPESSGPSAGVRIDTVGNVVTVHTFSGSVWGETATLEPTVTIGVFEGEEEYMFGRVASIAADDEGNVYVLDSQAPAVRVFVHEGRFIRSMGTRGEGPGELNSPSALGVLSDGRVLVRDPRNARVQVFGADGSPGGQWPVVSPTYYTPAPIWVDDTDRSLIVTKEATPDAPTILIEVDRMGTVLDTIPEPSDAFETPTLVASRGGGRSMMEVPFSAQRVWTLHPNGSMVVGTSEAYRLDMISKDRMTLRIEKAYEPVPVSGEERAFQEERATRMLRNTQPDWEWNGPEIPREKPPFKTVFAAQDGRIWVSLYTPSEEVENPSYDPEQEGSMRMTWTERVAFDVFESDGTYLGRVDAPSGFVTFPVPMFDSTGVWGVAQGEMGEQQVVRYELRLPEDV